MRPPNSLLMHIANFLTLPEVEMTNDGTVL